ncbi:CKLF-like MARVEL transmembrane domain-containing protein 6 isoform X2 [Mustela putorius furo]|uniref:CKLF-like MARVEL transmembrane domain-containing protein 6 isoform X2 n=2 Tax=Mustela TaxID=9665 RepID=A0A8U0SLE3_MUSPF|nr:CKLF-like MARVEL transmembrane domain-containing protein 6 isoform X2 [Mustela putorius furo]XP_044944943.1 CKLF-like MARVEL transmembrane domain-containing protein 6 isoform X2 [Mustela putorius furo]
MENGAVYGPTTEEDPGPARGARSGLAAYFSLGRLPMRRLALKALQLLLSLLAFICEEVVSQCTLCGGLYFFEFVSCSAFLLSLLILIVYCTPVYDQVDTPKVKQSDFYLTAGTGFVFLLASIIFVSTHDRTKAEIAATNRHKGEKRVSWKMKAGARSALLAGGTLTQRDPRHLPSPRC